jgi:hypothetical protein
MVTEDETELSRVRRRAMWMAVGDCMRRGLMAQEVRGLLLVVCDEQDRRN